MDEQIFHRINQTWTNPALDRVMAAASSFDLWWPVLVLVAGLLAWRGGARARWFLLTLAVLLVIGETVVDNPLKHAIHRLRPWQAMAGVRRVELARAARPRAVTLFRPAAVSVTSAPTEITVADPSPGRSFPSSHVVNNFCAAIALALFFGWRGALYFLPATLVAYSRIYVGAHWPSDVFVSIVIACGLSFVVVGGMQSCAQRWAKPKVPEPDAP